MQWLGPHYSLKQHDKNIKKNTKYIPAKMLHLIAGTLSASMGGLHP